MRISWLLSFSLGIAILACESRPAVVRVGVAVPVSWSSAIALARNDDPRAPIQLVMDSAVLDSTGAGAAIRYAQWLVSQHVAAVIGHRGSRASVAAAPIYNQHHVVQIAPAASSRFLREQGPWSYALVPTALQEGTFLAAFTDTALHARRLAVFQHHDEYGNGIRDGIRAEAAGRGMQIVYDQNFLPVGAHSDPRDVENVTRAALAMHPDALVIAISGPDTWAAVRDVHRLRPDLPVISADGALADPDRGPLAAVEGTYFVRFWGPTDSAGSAFAAHYERLFGTAPDHGQALTYDAYRLLGAAVDAGARTPSQIRSFLEGLGRTRPTYHGLVQSYQFVDGRPANPRMEIVLVRHGQLVSLPAAGDRR